MELIQQQLETTVLAIASGKGGTGKSIIAASIAYLLAHCGFKTLLVDMDLFTSGLTFYTLATYPRKVSVSLHDVFASSTDFNEVPSIEIPHPFCEGRLFLLPAISKKKRTVSELNIGRRFDDIERFIPKVKKIIDRAVEQDFKYIILDTRGGSDLTSISSILAAKNFLIVTEADKTSWDVGDVLLSAVDEAEETYAIEFSEHEKLTSETNNSTENEVTRLGFIINKNVLPSQAIEAFLRQQWACPSLTTIPLDENAIRYFQEDTVPVAADMACPFSIALIPIIRQLFLSNSWNAEQVKALKDLESLAEEGIEREKNRQRLLHRTESFSILLRIYGLILSTAILAYLTYSLIQKDDPYAFYTGIIAAVLVFFMTVSEPTFMEKLIISLPMFRRMRD